MTLHDYLLYRKLTGKPDNPYPDTIKDNEDMERKKKNWENSIAMQLNDSPISAPWSEARNYCLWLGDKTGLPIDLPTEAQWEYVANFYGQWAFATDSFRIDAGFNAPIPLQAMASAFIAQGGRFPVGSFPPNQLGLYDMAGGGREWMYDWYDSQYYAISPELNPRGPEKGEILSLGFGERKRKYQAHAVRNFALLIFTSGSSDLRFKGEDTPYDNQKGVMTEFTFRCAINKPEAITP